MDEFKIIKKIHICKQCKRTFKRKKNYDVHLIICEQLHDDKKMKMAFLDEEKHMPTQRQMFYLMRNLIEKCDKLEGEVERLEKYANITKKQINALDWLNNNISSSTDFNKWLENIEVSQEELNNIFKCGYIEGIYQILEKRLPLESSQNHPIKCFTQNNNIFFIFNDNKWCHMTINEFNFLANKVNMMVMRAFQLWKEKHKDKIETDDRMHDIYTENMRIVFGENKTNHQIIIKLKAKLYAYLKCDLKNIIKYEFAF